MVASNQTKFHISPGSRTFRRCVAKYSCPFGDGAHTDLLGIAHSGGGIANPNGRDLEVGPMIDGHYTVGTPNRTQTWTKDGQKLSPVEARRRRIELARRAEADETEDAKSAPSGKPRSSTMTPGSRLKEFELAENSTDAGVLAMLAGSTDPAVRLVVLRNPAVATSTLEQLAMSEDQGWKVYRLAAFEELGFRYQDEEDARELEIDRQLALKAPAAAVLSAMPEPIYQAKTLPERRTLIGKAVEQLGRMLKVSVKVAGWVNRVAWKVAIGSDGIKIVSLPRRVARDLSRKGVLGFLVEMFVSVAEKPFSSKSLSKQLGFGW
jgi:hypothetical protein